MLVLWDVAYTCLHYMYMHKHTPMHKIKVWSTGKRWQLPYDKRIFGCFAKCAYPRRIQHSILDCNAWQAANASSYMQKRAKLFEYEIHIPRPRRLVVPKPSKIQFLHLDAWPRSLRERSWRMQKVVPNCPQNPLLHFRNNDNNDIVSHVSLKPTPLTDQLAREPVPAGRIPWVSSPASAACANLSPGISRVTSQGRRPIDKEQEESQQSGKNMQKPVQCSLSLSHVECRATVSLTHIYSCTADFFPQIYLRTVWACKCGPWVSQPSLIHAGIVV